MYIKEQVPCVNEVVLELSDGVYNLGFQSCTTLQIHLASECVLGTD